MRKLLYILLLLPFASFGQTLLPCGEASVIYVENASGYTFVASVTATANSPYATVTTGTVSMTGATEIWVATSDFTGSATTPAAPTDNLGNTYTLVKSQSQGGSPRINLYVKYAPTVSGSMTFTFPTTVASFPGIIAAGFTGSATSSADQNNSAAWGSLSGTVTKQPGSITPSANGSLIITAANVFVAASAPTIDAGFSTPIFQQSNAGQTYSMMLSYLVQSTAASVNPNITFTPSGANACGVIANSKP